MSDGAISGRGAARRPADLEGLQERIAHRFAQSRLLYIALTHRSCGAPHNERLEFLGDSVLNLLVSAELFTRFPDLSEGELSRLRTHLVRQDSLHRLAQSIELGSSLRLGEGELRSGGAQRPSILADALEALVGAAFVDGGLPAAQAVLRRLMGPLLDQIDPAEFGKDAKTRLQEHLQAHRIPLPRYTIVSTSGAAHHQRFEVECAIPRLSIRALGNGSSRRAAEQMSAERAFEKIRDAR